MRAGDSDRDRTIAHLREAYAEGRLTSDEFQQRLELASSARTFGELDRITSDLPFPTQPYEPATPEPTVDDYRMRGRWVTWAGVALLLTFIWWASRGDDYDPSYWPAWAIVPWGIVLGIQTLRGR